MSKHTKFLDKLKEKGFTAKDIPKAILLQEIMYTVWLTVTWTACYFFPPSQFPILKKPIESIMARMPQKLSNTFAGNGFLASRFGQAYVESSCFRKLVRPLTFPAGIIVTIKLLEMTRTWDFNVLEKKFEQLFKKKSVPLNSPVSSDDVHSFPGLEKVKLKAMNTFGSSKSILTPITINSLGSKIFI